ncbi:MAG: D-2-hydroxyacid dehydrogenase family protein [Rhodospirillales bacterium]|jgi:phosphoglycerate dehydrogenase-like enzyme|nr:hydroxyacid dehydrogenase [Rhodospirillaceae bacterium]MDP6429509.1 D-2-hydroxyacid dehydrogenase family protein [Rhodospirillales bacterium]MDP6645552.1 D-2-hydroxyacid dehydrogenase family protein [Rhodospirillales bacterium]
MHKAAILDDYQNVALGFADWRRLGGEVEVTVFNDHLSGEEAIAKRLRDFDILVLNRERTPIPETLLLRLPNLKLMTTSGMYNRSVDMEAARARGIDVCGTEMKSASTPELTWGLILALARQIPREDQNVRAGRWQETVGVGLAGKVLGIIGLGKLGTPVARIGQAFNMEVIAWSPNLTQERADEVGVRCVDKDTLMSSADFITLHMPLSERSRGILQADDLAKIKSTAFLINTSRGPLIDEGALIDALQRKLFAGAGLDVYDVEPLPADHPIRRLDNTVLTPHLGYVSRDTYETSFAQTVDNIEAWLKGTPQRLINGV